MFTIVNTTNIYHIAKFDKSNSDHIIGGKIVTRCNRRLTWFNDNSRFPLNWTAENEWLANGSKTRHCQKCGTVSEFQAIADRDSKALEQERIKRERYNQEQRNRVEKMRDEHHNELVPELYSLIQSYARDLGLQVERRARGSKIAFFVHTDNGVHKFTLRGSF